MVIMDINMHYYEKKQMRIPIMTLTLLLLFIVGCSDESQQAGSVETSTTVTVEPVLKTDPVRYTRGLKLYQQTCGACHGKQGEGAPGWQQRDKQGKFLPPPLNGSGHTWHHPKAVLLDIINNGTLRLGGNMPAWKDKLSDDQIEDILFWVQSQWDKEIFQAWYSNNQAVEDNVSQ